MGIDALNCFCSPLSFLWTFKKKRKNEQCSWMTHEYALFHLSKYSSPIILRSCLVWTCLSNKFLYPQSMSLRYTKNLHHFTSQMPFSSHQRILSNKSWIDPSEKIWFHSSTISIKCWAVRRFEITIIWQKIVTRPDAFFPTTHLHLKLASLNWLL